jgi:hypothetical protein
MGNTRELHAHGGLAVPNPTPRKIRRTIMTATATATTRTEHIESDVHTLLEQIRLGETIILVDDEDVPQGILVSLRKDPNQTVPVVAGNVPQRLEKLDDGDAVPIFGIDGYIHATLISLQPAKKEQLSTEEWIAKLDEINERFRNVPQSEQSAVELLSEMRR